MSRFTPRSTWFRAFPKAFTAFERLFERLLAFRNRRSSTLLGLEVLEARVVPSIMVTLGAPSTSVTAGNNTSIVLDLSSSPTSSLTVNLGIGSDGEGDALAAWETNYSISSTSQTSLSGSGGTVTFAAGQTSLDLNVSTVNNLSTIEGFRVTVQPGSGYQAGNGNVGSGGGWAGQTEDVQISPGSSSAGSGGSGGSGLRTTTTYLDAPSMVTCAQAINLSALVTSLDEGPTPPTGTITFMDGSSVLGTVTLAGNGSAAVLLAPTPWTVGTHTVTADYSGDGSYASSVSTDETITVTPQVYQTGYQEPLIVSAENGLLQSLSSELGTDETSTPTVVSGPSNGTLQILSDGSFYYIPNPGFVGTDSFTYQATNPIGTGTVDITVTDQTPVVYAQTYTVEADQIFSTYPPDDAVDGESDQGLLAGASGGSDAFWTAQLVSGPSNGTLSLDPDGNFAYEPNPGFVGTDTFTYDATDGALTSAPATVTLNVVDPPPAGYNQTYTTLADEPLEVTDGGLLSGASGGSGDTLAAVLVSGPSNGNLDLASDGTFTYDPNESFVGNDQFTYQITDGMLTSPTYTATIQVQDQALDTMDENFSVVHDQVLTETADEGLLPLVTSSDPNTNLTFSLDAAPANGTATVYPDGAFSYTPNPGFAGTDSFTYQVSDGILTSTPSTITIDVTDNPPEAASSSFTATENQPLLVTAANGVLAGSSDADGDSITASLNSGPSNGTLTLNSDGSFIYTPANGFVGTDSFTFQPYDGIEYGQTTTATITVQADPNVPTSAPPTAVSSSYQVLSGTTLTIGSSQGILSGDSDPNSRPLTAQLSSGPSDGTLTLNALGSFQYIPNPGFVGTDSFTYQAFNGQSYSTTATVTINVTDTAPSASQASYSVVQGQTLIVPSSQGVLAGASDADANPMTAIQVSSPSNGTLTLNSDGSFTYVPNPGFIGTDSFSFVASDGTLSSTPTTATINVTDIAPVAGSSSYQIGHDHVLNVAAWNGVLAGATDADGNAISAVLLNGPAHGTLSLNSNGSFQYTPSAGYIGTDSFTFAPTDGVLQGNPVAVALTVTNPLPAAANVTLQYSPGARLSVGTAGGLLNYGYDPLGYNLSATLVSGPSGGSLVLNANGTFTYTPNAGFSGTDSFTYTLSDGYGTSTTATVTLQPLSPASASPTIFPPGVVNQSYSLSHDTLLSTLSGGTGVLAGASDPQGFPLSAILVTNVQHGTLVLLADGQFVYQPNPGYFGTDQFTYQASDGLALSNIATVTLTINETAPAAASSSFTVAANRSLYVSPTSGVLSGASDAQNDSLTAVLVGGPSHGSVSLFPDGSFDYTPTPGYVGPDTFTFQASDGILSSATQTVSFNVVDPAPGVGNSTYSVVHDTMLIVSAAPTGGIGSVPILPGLPGSAGQGLLANVSNPSGNPLSAVLVNGPSNGSLVFNANGSFRYTPGSGYIGPDSFTYYVTDGTVSSQVATVTINVTDQAPVAAPLTYSTPHDQSLVVTASTGLMSSTTDGDGDPLTLSVLSQPSNGTLTSNADGSFEYTPNAGWAGVDTFTYSVSDGVLNTGPVTVTINVTDSPPSVTSPTFTITHDTQYLADSVNGLLSFASDADGDPLTLSVLSQPSNGTLTYFNDGAFKYVPNTGFVGTDSFTYKVNDGVYDSNIGKVTINVVNSAPVAANLTYSTNHDQVLAVQAWSTSSGGVQGLVANGTDNDKDPLTATILTQPANGTLQAYADGGFIYTPNASFVGTDSFTYTLSDGVATSNVATVTLNVINTPPSVPSMTFSVSRDSILSVANPDQGALAPPAADAQGDPITATLVTSTTHGTFTFQPDGTFLYQPSKGYVGPDQFTFSVTDGFATVTVTDTINVTEPTPTANNVSYTYTSGQTFSIGSTGTNNGVLGNASSPNGDPLTAILVSQASQGTVSLNTDGSFTYTPNGTSTTPDSFQYKVFDGYGYSGVATVTLVPSTDTYASQMTVAQAVRTTANADATQTLNQATLAANITQLTSEFNSMSTFNTAARNQGVIVANTATTQATSLAVQQVQNQATDDANQATATATYNQAMLANNAQRWLSQAQADEANYESTNSANQTVGTGITSAQVTDLNAQASADATFVSVQNSAYTTQVASNAAAEDAFNSASVSAQSTYQEAQAQAVAAYQSSLASAASAESSAFAAAQSAYQSAVASATSAMQADESTADSIFQGLISTAQANRSAALSAAQTAYNTAVAAAASTYGTPQPGDPAPPNVNSDPNYQAAVAAAQATYANAIAAADGAYQLTYNSASAARTAAITLAQSAYNEAAATAQTTEQAAKAAAQSTYQSALVAAQVTHDQSLTAAQAALAAALSSANATWSNGAQAANLAYDNAVSSAQTTFQSSVDSAQATYQSTMTSLAATYAASSAAASLTFYSTLTTDQIAYNKAAAAALATQNAAIQSSQAQYQSQVQAVILAQQAAQQSAKSTFNSVQASATLTYNQAIARAQTNYQFASTIAQAKYDLSIKPAQLANTISLTWANTVWTAKYAWAQLRYTAALVNPTISNQQARKNLAVAQAQADVAYQTAAGNAAVKLMQAEQGPANTQAQALAAATAAEVSAAATAEATNTATVAPAAQTMQVAIESAVATMATSTTSYGQIANQAVDAASKAYTAALTAAMQTKQSNDSAALIVMGQAINAASSAYNNGQNAALQVLSSATGQATATLNAATASAYSDWASANLNANDTYQNSVDSAYATLASSTATANATLLSAQASAQQQEAASFTSSQATYLSSLAAAQEAEDATLGASGATFANAMGVAWANYAGTPSSPGLTGAWYSEQSAVAAAAATSVQNWANGQGTNSANYYAAVNQAAATQTAADNLANENYDQIWDADYSGITGALSGYSVVLGTDAATWEGDVDAAISNYVASRLAAVANAQNSAGTAAATWTATQDSNAATLQGAISTADATRLSSMSAAYMTIAQTISLGQSSEASSYDAAQKTETASIATSLQSWTSSLTSAANTDTSAVATALQTRENAGATALATELASMATSDQTFFDSLWTAWNKVNQALVSADQTQVTNVGQASQTLANQLLTAQSTFANAMATANGANAVSLAAAEWTFRIAQTQINNARANANANATLQLLINRDVSLFTSPYATGNGPGSNQGSNNSNRDIWTRIAGGLDYLTGGTSDKILLSPQFGAALNAVDGFFAGMADALTAGLSTRARAAMWGQTATQNHSGAFFTAGQITGTVLSLAIGAGNPCTLSTAGQIGFRGLQAIEGVGNAINTVENIVNGKPLSAALSALSTFSNVANFLKACFVAGTPILTPDGSKPIEQFQAGDLVLARSEHDPEGILTTKVVLQTFVRVSPILNLHVGGRIIGTTAEHPFFVKDQGWTEAHYLRAGDLLQTHDGEWIRCDGVAPSGRVETVYNMEVEDFHTYFVGDRSWGWDVWAHNATCANIGTIGEKAARKALQRRGHTIVGSIQNNSGHGIDLITRKGGKLFFWEVKTSTVGSMKLSAAQAAGAESFVASRLGRAFGWKGMTPGELKLASGLQKEIAANGGKVYGGIIHIPDLYSGSGSTIRFLPWLPPVP